VKLLSLINVVLFFAGAQAQGSEVSADFAGITAWFDSEIPRGNNYPVKNSLPRGDTIKFCAGAGCKIKLPFTFSASNIRRAADAMKSVCRQDTAACEREGLRHAVRELDRIVRDERLKRTSFDEIIRNSINRDNGNNPGSFTDKLSQNQVYLRDCVDQAANGSSYLIVLASHGLIRHHRILAPSMINLFVQPHFFSRIQEIGGRTYRFDLFQTPRTSFDKLPGVESSR